MINNLDEKKIGERIKENRKAMNLSQDELASRIGCARQTLSKWEQGNLSPLLSDCIQMCNVFECDIGYLLCEYNAKRHVSADICEVTGLSETAVTSLMDYNRLDVINALDTLISDDCFFKVLNGIGNFCECFVEFVLSEKDFYSLDTNKDRYVFAMTTDFPLKEREALLYKFEAQNEFVKLIENIAQRQLEKQIKCNSKSVATHILGW